MTVSPDRRRAAEERVLAQYEDALMAVTTIAEARADNPRLADWDPVWPLPGERIRLTELWPFIFAEEVRLKRSYPDTVVHYTFRFWSRPECLFAVEEPLWHLETLCEPEPRFNDLFLVHLHELIAKRVRSLESCTPGTIVELWRHGPWSRMISRIVSDELPSSPRDQELAARALEHIEAEGLKE